MAREPLPLPLRLRRELPVGGSSLVVDAVLEVGDVLMVDGSREVLLVADGGRVVRDWTGSGCESSLGVGSVVRLIGSTSEARSRELFDEPQG